MATTKAAVLDFVAANPGAGSRKVSEHLSIKADRASVTLYQLFKQGRVTRKVIGHTPSHVPIYVYWFNQKQTVSNGKDSNGPDIITNTIGQLIDQLASTIANQVVSRVRDHIQVELTSILPPNLHALSMPPELVQIAAPQASQAPHKRKFKALLMGLIPSQADDVKRDQNICGHFEFRTFLSSHSGHGEAGLQQDIDWADVVFFNPKYASHKSEHMVLKTNTPMIKFGGGSGGAKLALTQWLVNQEVAA